MCTTFETAAFARAYGSPATDRRDAAVEAAVAYEIERNRQIGDVLRAAMMAIRTIGEPQYGYLNPAYDVDGILSGIEDMLPDTDGGVCLADLRERLEDRARVGEAL